MALRDQFSRALELTRLHRNFQSYFRIIPALTDELKRESFHVRHQVYCQELGWEPPNEAQQETDEFDPQAHHCLLQSVKDDSYVGCIRLVCPHPDHPNQPLPFQHACAQTLDPGKPDLNLQLRGAMAEVSRLAVVGRYRRRRHEQAQAAPISDSDYGNAERPRFPYIPVGLYMGMLELARRHDIEVLYLLTEPALAHHFNMLGGKLTPIGGPIEHRGTRVPFEMRVDEVIGGMNLLLRPLFRVICDDIEKGFKQSHYVA